jgi:hypothetical protein
MCCSSGIGCDQALGWRLSPAVGHPGAKKGTTMELLVLAIVAIAGVGLYRFMRTRSAH